VYTLLNKVVGVLPSLSLVPTRSVDAVVDTVDIIYTGLINNSFTGNICVHSNLTVTFTVASLLPGTVHHIPLSDIKTFVVGLCVISLFTYS
jgi:hypothetical protein